MLMFFVMATCAGTTAMVMVVPMAVAVAMIVIV